MTDPKTGPAEVVLSRSGEQIVEVTGSERLAYLEATTSQSFKDARPGTVTAALVLDATGGPLAAFTALVLADRLWLVCPSPEVTASVMEVLGGRTFLADARFTVREDSVVIRIHSEAVLPGDGREQAHVLPGSPAEFVRHAWSGVSVVPRAGSVRATPSGNVVIADDTVLPSLILAGEEREVDELVERLVAAGAGLGDDAELESLRVAAGGAAWGSEIASPHLPEELGLLATHVHLAKGCYPGQEAVARMWMLGRPRRRLARVALHGPDVTSVVRGWRVGEGRSAVEVTAVAGRIGLAFVPGGAEVGARFGEEVVVEVLAFPGAAEHPPGHDPAMKRRRDRAPADEAPPRRAPRPPSIS